MTLAQQEEKIIPARIAKLKEFDATDPIYVEKVERFIKAFEYVAEITEEDEETSHALIKSFLKNAFPDRTTPAPAPSVPQFTRIGTTTGRYASVTSNLRDIPLPPPVTELPGVDIRKVLGYVILNKTTERISNHFLGAIFETHEDARVALRDFLTKDQQVPIFGTGSAMRNYEIVPVSKNEMT
jgi:hypothetical protein